MIKLGMLIGGRYEVLEKIGTGGMSDVYKAKDQKLNRFVAVKVLKQEFSENRNFVSKFRVEAQAAAGLMHPNIVNVYDVGEENGIHYIVMELVEGITLKNISKRKYGLTTKEAISIAIQVAMGIEAAHNNHIIHRGRNSVSNTTGAVWLHFTIPPIGKRDRVYRRGQPGGCNTPMGCHNKVARSKPHKHGRTVHDPYRTGIRRPQTHSGRAVNAYLTLRSAGLTT